MIPSPDTGFVYPKTGLDADLRFDTSPSFVSAGSAFFDDTNDFVNCGDHANSQMTTGDFSVVYWAKTTGTAEHFCVSKQDGASDYDGYRFGFKGDGVTRSSIQVDGSNKTGDVDGTAIVNDGEWHHFAFTVDRSSNLLCYVDGQLDKTTDISSISGSIDPDEDLILGASYSGANQNYGGCLCNVGIYKGTVLTQAQVRSIMRATNYTATAAVVTPSLYYLLDDDYNDSTGNQNGTNNGSLLIGDRARLPSGLDITANQLNAATLSGRGVLLDGSADYGYAEDGGVDLSSGGTVSVWVKPSSISANSHFIMETNTNGSNRFALGRNTDKFFVSYYDGTPYDGHFSTGLIQPDTWYHIIATTNGSDTFQLFVDGKSYTETYSTQGISGSNLTSMGVKHADLASSGGQFFDGVISDLRIYNTVLSAAQIQELFDTPETVLPSGVSASALQWHTPLTDYDTDGTDDNLDGMYMFNQGATRTNKIYYGGFLMTGGEMVQAQPNCPQLGLTSFSTRCVWNDSNTVARIAPSGTTLDCGGAFTYLFWVNTFSANPDARIIDCTAGVSSENEKGPSIFLDNASGGRMVIRTTLRFDTTAYTWNTSSVQTRNGQWTQVGVTFPGGTGGEVIVYVNGVAQSMTSPSSRSGTQGTDIGVKDIGGAGASVVWDGVISEFATFPGTALDAASVLQTYNSGKMGFDLLTDVGNYDNSGDLAGWWKFDNPYLVKDLKGSTDATWNNTPNLSTFPECVDEGTTLYGTPTSARVSSFSYQLDGTGYASIGDSALTLNPTTAGWSLSVWVKYLNLGSNASTIILDRDTVNDRWHLKVRDDASDIIQFNFGDGSGTTDINGPAIVKGAWTHIGITLNYGTDVGRIFINGSKHGSDVDISARTANCPADGILGIGGNAGSDTKFRGTIAGVRVFNATLEDGDVAALYTSGLRTVSGDT